MSPVGLAATLLLCTLILAALWRWINDGGVRSKTSLQPPKGNWWQLPWIGESLAFFIEGPYHFYCKRNARYGGLFRSQIAGHDTAMISCPEAAAFVLTTHHKTFPSVFPSAFTNLLFLVPISGYLIIEGAKCVRSSLQTSVLQLKVGTVEEIVKWALSSWEHKPFVVMHREARKMAFHVALNAIIDMKPCAESMQIFEDFIYISKGSVSPIRLKIPGTSYHTALKKREQISTSLQFVIAKRRVEKLVNECILDKLMQLRKEDGNFLSNEEIISLVIGLLFAGYENPSSFLVWLVKYLGENPKILEEVKAEQKGIKLSKSSYEDPLCWSDFENMPVSFKVIRETLRLGSVAAFLTRQASADVNYKGTLIPKNWLVQVSVVNLHLNPKYHKDAYKFDPSRFQEPTKSTTYMPFGKGAHMCPGRDLLKIQALIFLHYLVTNYSWESIIRTEKVDNFPSRVPKGGLPIKLFKRSI